MSTLIELPKLNILTELPKPSTDILAEVAKLVTTPNLEPVVASEDKIKPVFEMLHWAPLAVWSWNIKEDTCTICRNNIMDMCIECSTNNRDGTMCHLSKGTCGHYFHHHCVDKWVQSQTICPNCTQLWSYEKEKINIETA